MAALHIYAMSAICLSSLDDRQLEGCDTENLKHSLLHLLTDFHRLVSSLLFLIDPTKVDRVRSDVFRALLESRNGHKIVVRR